MIVAKLPKREYTCYMCKEYKMRHHQYIYKTYEIGVTKSEELKICRKCAIREHGSKNKHILDDVIEERTKKWLTPNHQD